MIRGVGWVFAVLLASDAGAGQVFQSEECEDLELIAREYLSLERAGLRWQGGEPLCLSRLKLKTWKKDRGAAVPDPALADPDYVIPSSRKMKIKTKRTPDDRVLVHFSYVAKKTGKEVSVSDEFELRLNFGKARSQKGCATLIRAPRYLVMDGSCVEE